MIKKSNVKMFLSNFKKLLYESKIERDENFALAFSKNITKEFLDDFMDSDSKSLWVYGETGSGKSSVADILMSMKDKNFSAKKISMTNEDLKNSVFSSEDGDCFIRDETAKDFGEGSGQLMATIQDLTETLRQRRNSFALLAPIIKGHGFIHYYLHVLQSSINLERDSVKSFIKNGGKFVYFRVGIQDKNLHYIGYIILRTELNTKLWKDYQTKKNKFLEEVSSGERSTGLNYTDEAIKFLKLIDLSQYPKKGNRLVFIKQNTNYTNTQCTSIHSELERILSLQSESKGEKKTKRVIL